MFTPFRTVLNWNHQLSKRPMPFSTGLCLFTSFFLQFTPLDELETAPFLMFFLHTCIPECIPSILQRFVLGEKPWEKNRLKNERSKGIVFPVFTSLPAYSTYRSRARFLGIKKSARRESNPRPSPWQGDVVPLYYSRMCLLRRKCYYICFSPIVKQFLER